MIMKNRKNLPKLFLSLISPSLLLGYTSVVGATTLTFFGEDLSSNEDERMTFTPNADQARDEFLSYFDQIEIEDFENFSKGTLGPITLTFGDTTATLSGGGQINELSTGTDRGLYPISGNKYWSFADLVSEDAFTLEFSTAQAAFGFSATDVGDAQGGSQFSLDFELLDGSIKNIPIPHTLPSPGGSVLYFGLIDTENPFTKVTFNSDRPAGFDGFAFDDMTIGRSNQIKESQDIPEPSSILGMIGIGFLGFLKLRKKSFSFQK